MARKVFISFLGTNNYVECIYDFGPNQSRPVRFVQEALIEQTCGGWTEYDRIYIFCTSKYKIGVNGSLEMNWFDDGQVRIESEIERIGLKHRLDDLKEKINLRPKVEAVEIEAGFSEEEIWGIFNTVYKKLEPEDEIYLDVTHAFRSIPLFSIVLFNYSRILLGSRLESVVYGAFEKLGPKPVVMKMNVEERVAPIINLMNIVRLQEYNQIATELKSFGRVSYLTKAIKSVAEDTANETVLAMASSITNLDEYIATIDLKSIKKGQFINAFRFSYKKVRNKSFLIEPIVNIIDILNQETIDFVNRDDFKNIEVAINWTIKHDMIMQAYPLAEEYLILRIASMYEHLRPLDSRGKKIAMKQFREIISSMLGMPEEDFVSKNWGGKLKDCPDVANQLSEEKLIKDFRPIYEPVRASRNSLAHGNGTISYSDLKSGVSKILACMEYLNPDYMQYPSTKSITDNQTI